MTDSYDVAVVGLGAMGSAAAYHLARRGLNVLGLDRYSPPHSLGSSHGETRIIREAYAEHPSYVPIVQRAHELWTELEQDTGRALLLQTAGLTIGPPDGDNITGAELSARRHHLPYERLSAKEVSRRYPGLRPEEATVAILDPRAGVLYPEACIEAHIQMARQNGATLRFEEPVTSWNGDGGGVRVVTSQDQYLADRLVLSAGAWMRSLTAELRLPVKVERQVLVWFEPAANPEHFTPQRCPIFIWEHVGGQIFYGFPDLGQGVKVARLHQGELTDPDALRREVGPDDTEPVRALLRRLLPDASGRQRAAQACMFTNTPDYHFLIDHHPVYSQVIIASPCSGHGFKFASAIGEILADLLIDGRSRFDLSLFALDRFAA